MISIVCVYNDKNILNGYLLKSIKDQSCDFEIITVDNTRKQYKSAAAALNHGGKQAKGKYIMFVHQDVDFSSIRLLEEAEELLDSTPNLGIAGVAGRSKYKTYRITNIKHGVPPRFAGRVRIKGPSEVQTLDECLVIIPRKVFDKLKYDEKTCDDWHLYVVDYCLSIKKLGYDVYAIPLSIYHAYIGRRSRNVLQIILDLGSLPKGYYITLEKLLIKHKDSKWIFTTCGTWSVLYPRFLQRVQKLPKDIMRHVFWKYLKAVKK